MPEHAALWPYWDRKIVLIGFGLMQVAAYIAVLMIAQDRPLPDPWPIVAVMGVLLGQCALAAAIAVFGPGRFSIRWISSAVVVGLGGVALLLIDRPRIISPEDVFLIATFAWLMWIVNQVPLWLCRFFLRARTCTDNSATSNAAQGQYGILQLMGLTLFVSLVFGIGRAILPAAAIESLKRMPVSEWLMFATIAIADGLVVATTVLGTLNNRYFSIGIMISAVSSLLVAYGVYSAFNLLSTSPANERIYFAVMLICTYLWLQISLLVMRAAGYRIVVGT